MKLKCIRKTTVWLTSYSKTASKKCKHGIEIHKYIVACIGLCTPMQNMIYCAPFCNLKLVHTLTYHLPKHIHVQPNVKLKVLTKTMKI